MAKSRIIKDLANNDVDTTTALKRAKVLFSELENQELLNWVNFELVGYPSDVSLPDYRIVKGNLRGSYFKGSMANHMKCTNVSLPLGNMPENIKDTLLSVYFCEGIDALKQLAERSDAEGSQLGKEIPADFFPVLATYNKDPFMNVIAARVVVGSHHIHNIFSTIENRLLDAFILLEKEFGNLDDLDLDASSKTPEEVRDIADKITVIVYNDHSVNIGDGNKIRGSTIASSIGDK